SLLSIPGLAWLGVFFLVAFYAVVSVGLGNVNTLYVPLPHWNPIHWNVGYIWQALKAVVPGGQTWDDFGRTIIYIVVAVLLPLSRTGTIGSIVLIALPMFGDYYTNDLMSGSPKTSMLGNVINNDLQFGPNKPVGSALTLLLAAFLLVLMLYYLRADQREVVAT